MHLNLGVGNLPTYKRRTAEQSVTEASELRSTTGLKSYMKYTVQRLS